MITETNMETTIEMTIEMTILEKVEVGLEKDDPKVMSEGKIEAVVDQNQNQGLIQEPVQTEIGEDVTNVDNMTILMTTVLTQT